MPYYIYILKSLTTGKRYTGSTQNLEARLKAHNDGLSPYTKGRGPWKLMNSEGYPTRSEAMKRERFLKTGKERDFLNEIISQCVWSAATQPDNGLICSPLVSNYFISFSSQLYQNIWQSKRNRLSGQILFGQISGFAGVS